MRKKIFTKILNYLKRAKDNFMFKIMVLTVIVIMLIAVVVFVLEVGGKGSQISTFMDSLWYTVVTISTTGYGDIVPKQPEGRLVGFILIFIGFILTAVASGIITSLFVEKKLKEGKGLKNVRWKNHIVVCGWNSYGDAILDSIVSAGRGKRYDIALVNELDEEEISRIIATHKELNIQFVKGNFVNEYILKRASISTADTAILLADTSSTSSHHNADERTILTAMAIKSLNPKIKTSAQLIKEENEEHLKRAEVDEIVTDGEFSGFLISNAAISPGIHQLVKELLSFQFGNTIIKSQIPKSMVNKTFGELATYFHEKKNSILIGVMTEEDDISLNDILSDDYSAIDEFIRRKFAEAEASFFDDEKSRMDIKINPGMDYVILDKDVAFVISRDLDQVA